MASTTTPLAETTADAFGNGGPDPLMDQHGDVAKSKMDKVLGRLPSLLSSKPVIIFGIILFFYLFVFAGIASLLGHSDAVTANTQLILGNYTNVSSSVGAGIAAGAGLTLLKRQNKAHRLALAAHDAAIEAKGLAEDTHRLLHLAFPDHAAALGQQPGRVTQPHHTPAGPSGAGGAPGAGASPAAGAATSGPGGSAPAGPAPGTAAGPAPDTAAGPASGGASPSGLAPDPATPPGPDSGPDLP
jgi:hypothetical protein